MPDPTKFLREYTRSISANLARGDATEHTHRPALKPVTSGSPLRTTLDGLGKWAFIEISDPWDAKNTMRDHMTHRSRKTHISHYPEALP